jgi:hypothetical protein
LIETWLTRELQKEYEERGRAKGRVEARLDFILSRMGRRFGGVDAPLEAAIRAIRSEGRLVELWNAAFEVDSLEEFRALLRG